MKTFSSKCFKNVHELARKPINFTWASEWYDTYLISFMICNLKYYKVFDSTDCSSFRHDFNSMSLMLINFVQFHWFVSLLTRSRIETIFGQKKQKLPWLYVNWMRTFTICKFSFGKNNDFIGLKRKKQLDWSRSILIKTKVATCFPSYNKLCLLYNKFVWKNGASSFQRLLNFFTDKISF